MPAFNVDSGFVLFTGTGCIGPRVPGTDAHAKAADYLYQKLKSFGSVDRFNRNYNYIRR